VRQVECVGLPEACTAHWVPQEVLEGHKVENDTSKAQSTAHRQNQPKPRVLFLVDCGVQN
jgi:hypothetical protein